MTSVSTNSTLDTSLGILGDSQCASREAPSCLPLTLLHANKCFAPHTMHAGRKINTWRRMETLDLTSEVKKLPLRKVSSSSGIHLKTFHVTLNAYVVPSKNTQCPFLSQTKAALTLLCCQSPFWVPLTAWTPVPALVLMLDNSNCPLGN